MNDHQTHLLHTVPQCPTKGLDRQIRLSLCLFSLLPLFYQFGHHSRVRSLSLVSSSQLLPRPTCACPITTPHYYYFLHAPPASHTATNSMIIELRHLFVLFPSIPSTLLLSSLLHSKGFPCSIRRLVYPISITSHFTGTLVCFSLSPSPTLT